MIVSELVHAAYRKIGVVGHGQAATAEQTQAGVDAFGHMVAAWALDGIDIGLTADGTPLGGVPTYTATSQSPLPAAFVEGAIYCLANRLAPEYAATGFDERAFKRGMRAALIKPCNATQPTALARGAVHHKWNATE